MGEQRKIKLLVLCSTKEKLIEDDFKKCLDKSKEYTDEKEGFKTDIDFIPYKKISSNNLYQKIIDEIDKNKRKSKFKMKVDFNDMLSLRNYPMIICLYSDGVNVIQARIEKNCSMMNNLRLVVYITCKRSIEEHLDYVKNAKKQY